MLDPKKINEMVQKVIDSMPDGLKNIPKDMQENMRLGLHDVFTKLDLVTREEFDAQVGVLHKTRAKLEALEKKLAELERQQSKP